MQYYGTRLSENISRREPEGYLLCLNVPVARTGVQEYLPEELGLAGENGRVIPVFRPESEVFSPETIASFEGMPVTNDHPPDGVDIENIRRLQAGHAHNVRRGAGNESDLLLADLIITDPALIDAVLSGKREISCGYTYELHEENGRYIQRKIRGNHIAVVDTGRAGRRVSIKDHQCYERRQNAMKKPLTRLLAKMAMDGGAEAVAEFIEEMLSGEAGGEPVPETRVQEEEPVTVEVPENREVTIDTESFAGLLERIDRLITLLAAAFTPAEPAVRDEDPAEEIAEIAEEAGNAAEAAVAETMEEVLGAESGNTETEVSEILEAEGDENCPAEDPVDAKDALRAALKAVRPVLAKMTPAQRRKACADIAANLHAGRSVADSGVYAALSAGKPSAGDPAELGKRIMASRNPNYKQ